jgi:hypothetical protein
LYILWRKRKRKEKRKKNLEVIHKAERVSNLTLNKKNVLKSVKEENLKKKRQTYRTAFGICNCDKTGKSKECHLIINPLHA